jgi:hypothetical protein
MLVIKAGIYPAYRGQDPVQSGQCGGGVSRTCVVVVAADAVVPKPAGARKSGAVVKPS